MTYARAPLLCDLLLDLERERQSWPNLEVRVYDDASPADYAPVEGMLRRNGWLYRRAEATHGKEGFAAWVTRTYRDLRGVGAAGDDAMLVFLPDDVRLCRNFLARALDLWCAIDDPRKISLNVLLDGLRRDGPRWTAFAPRRVGRVEQTQWVDGAFIAEAGFLRAVGHCVPPIHPARWRRNPALGSGVGQAVSRLLHRDGWHMYRVRRSLVVHVRAPSQMNPDVRTREPIDAADFIDGAGNAIRLERRIPVLASLATIPTRVAQLEQVVASLLPQVTRLRVYLNGYAEVPALLRHERIDIARSQDHGDRGDAGTFWWCGREPDAYLFTCDDDIVYPPDYVAHLVNAVEHYARRALVGLHGITLKPRLDSYYRDRRVIHCRRGLDRDCPVHLLGTGALAWHGRTLGLTPEDFPVPNMADVWLGVLCQQRRIPTVSIARPEEWLKVLPCEDTIFDRARGRDHAQTRAVQALGRWRLLPLPAVAG